MKFDMGKAWDDTTGLLRDNFGLVASILGLFYFLPQAIVALLVPEIANPEPVTPPPGADPEVVLAAMSAAYQEQIARSWPYWLAITLIQYVGVISVLALFAKGKSPTVGQALASGLKGTPSYLGTQLLFVVGASLLLGIPLGIAFALVPLLGVLLIFVMIPLVIYAAVKLLLVPAVIAMDGELNPIAAMRRSWRLTKGNSLMIFLFLAVLLIVLSLIALVAAMIFGTIFALFGEPVATIGTGLLQALVSAVLGGIFLLALAAIKRQLSGVTKDTAATTFE
ncbi:MAG: glycerophosphoryl diester phosphodiesterase membrane domain-containing protein [Erythrobacter sp.]